MATYGSLRRLSLILGFLVLGLSPFLASASISFEQCGTEFQALLAAGDTTAAKYVYKKIPDGLRHGYTPPLLITEAGCKRYCGSDAKIYPWSTVSNTLTTWIFPLAGGLILQAPFESTHPFSTLLVLCRWLGSPIASLTCILWNIKVTRKCALILDMAVPRKRVPGYKHRPIQEQINNDFYRVLDESVTGRRGEDAKTWPDLTVLPPEEREEASAFAELRDTLYILCTLNQFSFDHSKPDEVKALLQFALFSRNETLVRRRQKLGASLRRGRKHGVVQVLISLVWFLFALAISVFQAFGNLGDETTANNLALGLLMGWLPILISSSIIDQCPTNSEHAQEQLSEFLGIANNLQTHPATIPESLLTGFCGQARKKWHYPIGYSILTDVQLAIPSRKRGLLKYYIDGTLATPNSKPTIPLWVFKPTEFWQMIFAIFIVGSCIFSAVIISYNTPTVGLGCRSGGYMIFGILAATAFIIEIAGWTANRASEATSAIRRTILLGARATLVVLEVTNICWLTYIILSQTFGIYNSCTCRAANWARRGGYSDFGSAQVYQTDYLAEPYWVAGTVLGTLPLLTLVSIVYQWLTTAFLATEHWDKAMRGLKRVRMWKWCFHTEGGKRGFVNGPDMMRSRVLGQPYKGLVWKR
jgi:hypothetical protein